MEAENQCCRGSMDPQRHRDCGHEQLASTPCTSRKFLRIARRNTILKCLVVHSGNNETRRVFPESGVLSAMVGTPLSRNN